MIVGSIFDLIQVLFAQKSPVPVSVLHQRVSSRRVISPIESCWPVGWFQGDKMDVPISFSVVLTKLVIQTHTVKQTLAL